MKKNIQFLLVRSMHLSLYDFLITVAVAGTGSAIYVPILFKHLRKRRANRTNRWMDHPLLFLLHMLCSHLLLVRTPLIFPSLLPEKYSKWAIDIGADL